MKRNKKRALASGQPSQSKRPRFPPIEQERDGRSRLTEEDIRRVFAEELERAKPDWAEFIQSCIQNALKDTMQPMLSMENDFQKRKEAMELADIHSPHLGSANAITMAKSDARNLQLQLQNKLSLPLFTGNKLEEEGGAHIKVALIDANTRDVVRSGPESSIKLDIVVLEGDFNKDDEENWTQEEFENQVVKQREGKRPLLTGDLVVKLRGGVGELGELIFTDNSSWNRSKKFRIGLKVASGYCGNTRIREAKTDAFSVKEHRGEACRKHHPPKSDDEVWRLEKIAKDGKSHQKLSEAGIYKVEDFVLQMFTDSNKLREILGKSITAKKWDSLVRHAKTCETKWKLYLDHPDGILKHGAVFNTDGQLIGLVKDKMYVATHQFSAQDKEHGDTIVKKAFDNWNDAREFNGETFSGSMQKKSSSSSPSQALSGQNENLSPVSCDLAPRICASPVGPEAPPVNVRYIAEGISGITAAGLPIQAQSLNPQNATLNQNIDSLTQMEPSVDTNVQQFGQPYGSTSSFPASRNSRIIADGLPIQAQSLNPQSATLSQNIDSSTQMEPSVDTNVQPFGQTYGSTSSFSVSNTENDWINQLILDSEGLNLVATDQALFAPGQT